MDENLNINFTELEQDKIIDLPDSLSNISRTIQSRAVCDWHETDCNYTCQGGCQCSSQNDQCSCQNCQNCEGASCQTTQGSPPTSYGSIATETTISLMLSAIAGAASYLITYRETYASTPTDISTTTLSNTITGLTQNTSYTINYYGLNAYGIGPYMPSGVVVVTKKKTAVVPWSWIESNGSANAVQTRTAYQAIVSKGTLSDFSYLVWNDFVAKIHETAIAANSSWSVPAGYLPYENTLMNGSDKSMTAKRFNSAKMNIGSRVSTGIADVAIGDKIIGSYFITLATKLNEWIASL